MGKRLACGMVALSFGLIGWPMVHAQVLELPPPEESDTREAPPPKAKVHVEEHATPSESHASAPKGEEGTDPAEEGGHAPAKDAPKQGAAKAHGEEESPKSPDLSLPAHDKESQIGHSGQDKQALVASKGSGLVWFAAAFVTLVVAVFVLT